MVKSEFDLFSSRSNAKTAQAIRRDLKTLIENTPPVIDDRDPTGSRRKRDEALALLDKHYQRLSRQNQSSMLVNMIGTVLNRQGIVYKKNPHLIKEIAASCVKTMFLLLTTAIHLVKSLTSAFGLLPAVGLLIRDIGKHLIDVVSPVGHHPIQASLAAVGVLLYGTGEIIKSSMGIRPLLTYLSHGVKDLRNAMVDLIGPVEVQRFEKLVTSNFESTDPSTDYKPTLTTLRHNSTEEDPLPPSPAPL